MKQMTTNQFQTENFLISSVARPASPPKKPATGASFKLNPPTVTMNLNSQPESGTQLNRHNLTCFMKQIPWLAAILSFAFCVEALAQPSLQPLATSGLSEPYGIAVDEDGDFFITDSANNRVVKYISNTGALTNLAGVFGEIGNNDGPGIFARFFNPQGIVAARGGLLVTDAGNHRIRRVGFDGTVTTVAGNSAGSADGTGTAALFNSPAGIAVDASGNVYVADTLNSSVRRIDANNVVTTVATGFLRPTAVAVNTNTSEIFVADTGTHSIRVIRTDGTVELLAGSGSSFISGTRDSFIATNALFNGPRGLLWAGDRTGLIVSDTGNRMLRRVYFNTNSFINTYSAETFVPSAAETLVSPLGLALDEDGNIPLVDLGSGTLYNVQVTVPQPPVESPEIGIVILTTNSFGQLRTSLSPVVNSTFNNDVTVAILAERGTDTFYTLDPDITFPEDPSSRLTPPSYENGLPEFSISQSLILPSRDGSNVTIKSIGTQDGRKPSEIITARFLFNVAGPVINGKDLGDFTLQNETTGAEMWYTTDGTSPVNGAPSRLYTPDERLDIVSGTNDVTFTVRAFKTGYTPSPEITRVFAFSDLQTTRIGIARDFTAGIGSTIVVPIEVKLAPDKILKSLQFRVEVTPVPFDASALISSQLRHLTISTNDFIQIPPPSTNAPLASVSATSTNTGLAISFVGTSSGLDFNESGTVALLAIPIPPTVSNNQIYEIDVVQPSGTSDGLQTPVRMTTFEKRTITVSENMSYVVGDSAIADWYNAGDFGNTNINNNDVNNAFHASLGLFTPYSFTDVFDAMDAFPEDSATAVGGDGQIRFLDWQIILQRSLRLTTNNWSRSWATGGLRIAARQDQLGTAANSPAEVLTQSAESPIWSRQAAIGALAAEHAAPGNFANVPVYVKISENELVKGLQFRAIVTPEGDAPPLDQPVRFLPDALLPTPITLQGGQNGLAVNQAASAWTLLQNPFPSALTGEHALGHLQIAIPKTAELGDTYAIHFANADGAPNLQTQYDFESVPGAIWIGTEALRPAERISDEWKMRFFGALNHAWAGVDADPDGDGMTNLDEYLAGSNPVNLRFHEPSFDKGGVESFLLRWFGEIGKRYAVEWSTDLSRWSTVGMERVGKGDVEEIQDSNGLEGPRFYRLKVK